MRLSQVNTFSLRCLNPYNIITDMTQILNTTHKLERFYTCNF